MNQDFALLLLESPWWLPRVRSCLCVRVRVRVRLCVRVCVCVFV
jgi:hypothetical protein